jgi:DUF1680 family protein
VGVCTAGALPQHIFSLPPAVAGSVTSARVNLYAASRLSLTVPGAGGTRVNTTVSVDTSWPMAPGVGVTVHAPSKLGTFELILRIPGWVAAASVPIMVNGTAWKLAGQPGSYVHITLSPWPAGATSPGRCCHQVPISTERAQRYIRS